MGHCCQYCHERDAYCKCTEAELELREKLEDLESIDIEAIKREARREARAELVKHFEAFSQPCSWNYNQIKAVAGSLDLADQKEKP